MEAKTRMNIDLKITDDPNGHATLGGSSGGAAAFSMAWWHPDLFRRMIGWSPTLVTGSRRLNAGKSTGPMSR